MKYFFEVFCLFIFLFKINFAQSEDSILAQAGSIKITADEFMQRYELMPRVKTGIENQTIDKYNLLYSLIAEKLWALEAEDLNLDSSNIMETTFRGIEKMYVRDALYKAEIQSKIKITDQEMIDGAKRIYTKLSLNVLFENDSEKIFKDYYSLKNGVSFDSLSKLGDKIVPDIEVEYGEMNKVVEDSVFKLDSGEFSYPVKSSSGWIIFKVAEKNYTQSNESNATQRFSKIKKIIEERQKDEIYNRFYQKFFPGKQVEADKELFWSISNKIASSLKRKKETSSIPDSQNVNLDTEDILRIEAEFGTDSLQMPFIKFKKDPLSVQEFLRYFILDGFYSSDVQPKIIAAKINSRIRTLIEQELLAREGYKRGLQNLPEVKSSIAMWKYNFLSKIYGNNLKDSIKITEDDVYNYYLEKTKNNMNSTKVNILEILTDSLKVIEKVLNQLDKGKDFRTLASIHTKRKWTKDNGGEFGFFSSTMYGDIGKIAAKLKIGEVYGPLKVPEGYSIFKLIDKKETKDSLPDFQKVKDELKKELRYKKTESLFVDKTVQLAKKYNVKINDEALKSLKVFDLNMYTFRYFGFGGRIIAVPITIPFTEWVEPWKESLKEIP